MSDPFFSIIIGTRNRPDIIKQCLLSLKNQSFNNFEVILSDNSDLKVKQQNFKWIKKLSFKQLTYVTPDQVLNMHDNYNFALSFTKGRYVGVLTDKSLLRSFALNDLYNYLKENELDIVNYGHTGCTYHPNKLFKWIADIPNESPYFETYDPEQELLRRFNLATNLFLNDGIYGNFGKIFWGFYHKDLIRKIIDNFGKVFHGLSPDYTSAVLALKLAKNAVYYHKKIMLFVNNYVGNGQRAVTVPNATLNFLNTCTDDLNKLLDTLPIPRVYTLHNNCAYDYEIINRLCGYNYRLNLQNLCHRVYEDLQSFPFSSLSEKKFLWDNYNNFIETNRINISFMEEIEKDKPELAQPDKFFYEKLMNFVFKQENKINRLFSWFKWFSSTHHISLHSLIK